MQDQLPAIDEPWAEAWQGSARNPLRFAMGCLGFLPHGSEPIEDRPVLEKWQHDFLAGFFIGPDGKIVDDARHSISSGHGCGKTSVIAILALWFVLTHYDAKCVITAASQDQLRDGAWAELRKWLGKLPPQLKEQLEISEERLVIKAVPEMGFVVRRTASKSNPEALQGIHAKHVLYLVDEASGVDDIIFEVAAGSLSTKGAMACLFSNPTRPDGFFYQTHHRLRDRWRCWRVNSEDVPRARGHIRDIADAYGENSNKYRIRVLGLFPTAADDVVIPLEWLEAAVERDVSILDYIPIWGVDVGRFGDDSSALAKRQANRLLEPVTEWKGKNTMQLVGLIHEQYVTTHEDLQPKEILIDEIGIGAGVLDRLKELGLPARGVNVSEAPSSLDKCMRLRDELWWRGRQFFQAKSCTMPRDEKLIAELSGPTYDFHSNGKIVVESKKDMKERSLKSPNCADAFLLTFAGMAHRKLPQKRSRRDGPYPTPWAA